MANLVRKLAAVLIHSPGQAPCTKHTKRCDFWNWSEGGLRPACCTSHLLELLFYVADLLERNQIPFWLDYGTLLGAVRNGELIPWDDDVDLGVRKRDVNDVVGLAKEITRAGYHFDSSNPGLLRVGYSPTNLQYVDLFIWESDDGSMTTPLAADFALALIHI